MAEATALNVLDRALVGLVDRRVGVISKIEEAPCEAGDPDFFHLSAEPCNTRAFSRQGNFRSAAGASTSRAVAVAKAVGEAVERYCAAIFEIEELPLACAADAPFPCVDPAGFALYSRAQYAEQDFPFVPFTEATPVRWTPALDWATDQVVWVPAARVFIPYTYYLATGDQPIGQPISTGLACHTSLAEAAIGAICETIERDSVTITWQAMLAMPQIEVDTLSASNRDRIDRFERTGNVVTILDIRLDIEVPTVLSVLRNVSEATPALVVAASADPDPEAAVRKSLEELEHTRHYAQYMKSHIPRLEGGAAAVTAQLDHLNYFCDDARVAEAEFLLASHKRLSFAELPTLREPTSGATLDALAARVEAAGERVLLADVTTDDIRPLGLAVVRAMVPGLHPLGMGYKLRALGGSRLWEVPQRLALGGITRETGDNPAPHPYP